MQQTFTRIAREERIEEYVKRPRHCFLKLQIHRGKEFRRVTAVMYYSFMLALRHVLHFGLQAGGASILAPLMGSSLYA